MNNLHAPTVPSGPTSSAAATNGVAGHLSFAELQRKKDDIEAELKALGSVLDSVRLHTQTPGPLAFDDNQLIRVKHGVNMETPLLTRDGFPRADIDVAQSTTPPWTSWNTSCRRC